MTKGKCAQCGRFSTKYKEIATDSINGIDVARFSVWKFCSVRKDWCRNVASHCDSFINKKFFSRESKAKTEMEIEPLL